MRATVPASRLSERRPVTEYALQCVAAVIWALALLLLAALAPVHVREIGQDWQVTEALKSVGAAETLSLIRGVLTLRYLGIAVCLVASLLLMWRRAGHPVALLACVAFATLPFALSLSGYSDSWPYPYPWDQRLDVLRTGLSAAGLLSLIAFAFLFPDGRFRPRWTMLPAAGALLGFGVLLTAQIFGLGDAAWPALMLLVAGSLAASCAVQLARLRRAPPEQRRQTQGVVVALLATFGAALLSALAGLAAGVPAAVTAARLLGLLTPVVIAVFVPLSVIVAVERRGLWQTEERLSRRRLGSLRVTGLLAATLCLSGLGAPLYVAARAPEPGPLLPALRPVPLIVDTDLSHDDILALLLLLRHPSVEVRAVLISGTGEVRCEAGVRNALALIELAGRPGIPVACGREQPMTGNHAFPLEWRDSADNLYGLTLPQPSGGVAGISASQLLINTVSNVKDQPVILTLGPLTNVAEALQTEPAFAHKVRMLFAMGGAVNAGGNIAGSNAASGEAINNSVAEWNLWVDPRAANIVLSSGIPTVLVPLDGTRYVPASTEFLASLQNYRQTPVADFAYRLLLAREDFVRSGGYQFWDVLAASLLIDERLARYRELGLEVVEAEGPESGRIVITSDGSPALVAVWADRGRFERLVLETLNR